MGNVGLVFMNKPFVGQRVRLIKTDDQYTFLLPGSEGIISYIDAYGTLHVNWDEGSRLGLLPDYDEYELL